MFHIPYRWNIHPRAPKAHFEQFPDISPLIIQLLYNREIFDAETIHRFLDGGVALDDPFLLPDMETAVSEILAAIDAKAPIIVYGDYDADGVTSTTLLTQALRALGAKVSPYIPDRFSEGYGLNKNAISKLADSGTALIVTVDCGIRSAAEVAHGNALGLKFIVTDHHHVPTDDTGTDVLPPALAVINPKRQTNRYPFKDFAGVGVAFKLVQALKSARGIFEDVIGLRKEDLLDLVAIGTVADLVPLTGENRTLVKLGLEAMSLSERIGLNALLNLSGKGNKNITAETIGFMLGPRINAAGRLSHAKLAYQLLSTDDATLAQNLAVQLNQINTDRQQLTRQYTDMSMAQMMSEVDEIPDAIYLISNAEFNTGVVGLVASKLSEICYRPILVAKESETVTRGSARSIPEFDITHALDQCADLLVKYGGHAAAAGFTVKNENLPAFRERLLNIARSSFEVDKLKKTLIVDAELNLRGVNADLVTEIHRLQPFGMSNPSPVFVSRNLIVKHHALVGKDRSHLKMKLHDGKQLWDAIGFGMGTYWGQNEMPATIDAVYALEFNIWNGRTTLQLNLKDIQKSEETL